MSEVIKRRGARRRGESIRVPATRSFSPELLNALDSVTDNQSDFIEEWMWNNPKIILSKTLDAFLASPDFKEALIGASIAARLGAERYVELLPDGSWRILFYEHGERAQSKYESPGIVLILSPLGCDEIPAFLEAGGTQEEWFNLSFTNERDEIEKGLKNELQRIFKYHPSTP